MTQLIKAIAKFVNKKRVAPATQDATLPADKIRVGGKDCFFARFCRVLIKKPVNL